MNRNVSTALKQIHCFFSPIFFFCRFSRYQLPGWCGKQSTRIDAYRQPFDGQQTQMPTAKILCAFFTNQHDRNNEEYRIVHKQKKLQKQLSHHPNSITMSSPILDTLPNKCSVKTHPHSKSESRKHKNEKQFLKNTVTLSSIKQLKQQWSIRRCWPIF